MRTLIHAFASVSGVYHAIQTDPTVHDGHIVVVPPLLEVAVVCGTRPQAVDPTSSAFPTFIDQAAWRTVAAGRYDDAARLARCVVAGLATDPGDLPTATGAGTFRSVYDRIYGWGMASFEAQAIAALACEMYGADLIAALNNVMTAKNEWWYGEHGRAVHDFYASRPELRPRRAG